MDCGELQELWPGRLHVLSYEDDDFWQEACTSVLIEVSQASSPDWLYVLDADEFLLVDDGAGDLRQELAGVDDDCFQVRYDVQNWVSFSGLRRHPVVELPTADVAIRRQDVHRHARGRCAPTRSGAAT